MTTQIPRRGDKAHVQEPAHCIRDALGKLLKGDRVLNYCLVPRHDLRTPVVVTWPLN
jgi:hypothetical protein